MSCMQFREEETFKSNFFFLTCTNLFCQVLGNGQVIPLRIHVHDFVFSDLHGFVFSDLHDFLSCDIS